MRSDVVAVLRSIAGTTKMEDDTETFNTDKLDWWVPVYTDGTSISCDDNDGVIDGKLHDIKKWSMRTGYFQTSIQQNTERSNFPLESMPLTTLLPSLS